MSKKKPQPAAPTPRTLRAQIAKIDRELLDALSDRASLCQSLAEAVGAPGGEAESSAAAVDKLVEKNTGPVTERSVRAVLREVEAACRAITTHERVAYLGPEHTYSHQAALHRFGDATELVPVGAIGAVFDEVASGSCEWGVVPLENSTHGRVTDTLEAFAKSEVQICGELPLRIHHCLLGKGKRSDVRRVASKAQALAQCGSWLTKHLPGVDTQPVASTAEAAVMASADPAVAAIASEQAGVHHGLRVLAHGIEDQSDNITRFAVIGMAPAAKTGGDKTAIVFEVAHEPGSLADAMAIFKRAKLNLTWIESFPIPGSRTAGQEGGRYLFFVEFLGHQTELRARRAIANLEKKAVQLRVLGSYPQSPPID
ncbi:Prephenate dehydratase [Pseudobythopirellula maris]|uniref:Bifunctional chorismate mutase/prephenate dehydratase n=1 Tax=Pseudobythopirellula maris TaxID=2527991 RepID=A0A5C5ZTF5_9BACT|nr:prephenate dehydratase [Pseudobythopirellula maris]TWT90337.1 Prephenate dehydratase [Pseudobythopirellula maris]